MKVFILEAIQTCEDSPILGKILAFAGLDVESCKVFMAENRDFVVTDGNEADWCWRVSEMVIGQDFPVETYEFNLDGTERA
jgi:hypothetical protein